MAANYAVEDLQEWNQRIVELVQRFGLDPYTQEFEICDYEEMLSYMVYSGMPSHYPHWSYGKAYEKLKTLYDYGLSGLPYEMVINSDPCIAYLMRDNTLALQILTIAHVYGHNDFFKNNFTFRTIRAEFTIETFKAHANRVRHYVEDPSIGLDKVPLYPEEDILLFIRDHNPQLADWERDLLTMVHEQAQYFIPQIETKIMNEGWASFWHKRILEALDLPQGLRLEFFVRHTQVLSPTPGAINPYYVGMKVWEDIEKRWTHPSPEEVKEFGPKKETASEKLIEVREVERDSSFLRRYLTEELIRELNLFEYQSRGNEKVVSRVADEENWQAIKDTLLQNVGTGTIPVIKVEDADYNNNRSLFLKHYHDGRDLQIEYAEKTLQYLRQLWGRDVVLETVVNDKKSLLCYSEDKLAIKPVH